MLPNHSPIEITIITIILYVLYLPKLPNHVAVVKNINNVVVNSVKTLANKGFARVFNFLKKFNIL